MGNQRTSGLTKRGGVWHIDKLFRGIRIRESAATSDLAEAVGATREADRSDSKGARVYGVRPERTFRAAATKYLQENQQKRSIGDDAASFGDLDPFIGNCTLSEVHMGSLQRFIAKRRRMGSRRRRSTAHWRSSGESSIWRRHEWRDERGNDMAGDAPKIKLFPVTDARKPHTLSQCEEQASLFQELPDHLLRMALYKVNTGSRAGGVRPQMGVGTKSA